MGGLNLAMIYTPDYVDIEDTYEEILKLVDDFKINITNTHIGLPLILTNNTYPQIDAVITEIMNSRTRVIFIAHLYIDVILERMYALGIREEYVLLFIAGLFDDLYSQPAFVHRRIVSKGAIQVSQKVFIGQTGQTVLNKLNVYGEFMRILVCTTTPPFYISTPLTSFWSTAWTMKTRPL